MLNFSEQCTSKDGGIIYVMENASTVVQKKLHIKHSKLRNFMYEPDNPKKPRMGVGQVGQIKSSANWEAAQLMKKIL